MKLTLLPRLPVAIDSQIHCELFNCDLGAEICVRRQVAVHTGRGLAKKGTPNQIYGPCSSGRCVQGKDVKAAFNNLIAAKDRRDRIRALVAANKEKTDANRRRPSDSTLQVHEDPVSPIPAVAGVLPDPVE